jgi:hypothetical protein
MQTCRHWIFVLLAACSGACAGTPVAAPVAPVSPSLAPEAPVAEPEPEPEPESEPEPVAQAPSEPLKPRPAVLGGLPEEGAPRVQLIRITSPNTVQVHFNEPITLDEHFDPTQFRLSFATAYTEEDGESATYYYDPSGMEDETTSSRFAEHALEEEMTLRLTLAQPLDAEFCEEVAELITEATEDPGTSGGLFLHYHDAERGAIRDADGHRLDDIASHWVERPAVTVGYEGINLPPILAAGPIDCEFHR